MFCYQAYGLCVGANRPIHGLLASPSPAPPDIRIDFRATNPPPFPLTRFARLHASTDLNAQGEPTVTLWRLQGAELENYFQLRFADSGWSVEFVIDARATRVWATWSENVLFESVATFFRSVVWGTILWLRGIACLHASVVAVDGRAVALVGSPGAGKSTTAAAFVRSGQPALADDIAALVDLSDRFLVQPAYPSLALWENAAEGVLGSRDLPRIWETLDKRSLELHTKPGATSVGFNGEPLPLGAIYFLGPRHDPLRPTCIFRIAPADGMLRLIANQFTRTPLSDDQRALEFERWGRVAKYVPLRQVDRPNSLSSLPAVCEAIVQDLRLC